MSFDHKCYWEIAQFAFEIYIQMRFLVSRQTESWGLMKVVLCCQGCIKCLNRKGLDEEVKVLIVCMSYTLIHENGKNIK